MIDVAIIGGGPAGFTAAISTAENNANNINIDILEKGEPLKTLLWTGNGRCNLTNEIYDYKELALNYPRGEKFLYSAFSKFGVKETMDFFTSKNLELYTQEDNRVFPKSNDANTVRDFLINRAKSLGINIKNPVQVIKIEKENDKFLVYTGNSPKKYDKVIISTGGNYRNLPDSGYDFARNLGHTVTKLRPSLAAFCVREIWPASLAGVSINNAEIKAFFKGNLVADLPGDFVFTHKGISGPLAFKISSYCAFLDYDENTPLVLKIDFVPDKTPNELDKEILEDLDKDSKKSIENILKKYAPKSLIITLLGIELLDPDKKASQITREDRKTIIRLLKRAELSVKFPEPEEEIVTAGGVELDEVDSKTMESKIVPNLYFCGEVLNIDGLTGGFNLQACWSTGYVAGFNIVSN
jgi:predicted Rossmann fold flavoprotein